MMDRFDQVERLEEFCTDVLTRRNEAMANALVLSMMAPNHLRVWRFEDAPTELRLLSRHDPGDEKWLALVPPGLVGCGLAERMLDLWDGHLSHHEHPDMPGYRVVIAA